MLICLFCVLWSTLWDVRKNKAALYMLIRNDGHVKTAREKVKIDVNLSL